MPVYLFGTKESGDEGQKFTPNLMIAVSQEEALQKAFLRFLEENPTSTIEDFEEPDSITEIPKSFVELALSSYA